MAPASGWRSPARRRGRPHRVGRTGLRPEVRRGIGESHRHRPPAPSRRPAVLPPSGPWIAPRAPVPRLRLSSAPPVPPGLPPPPGPGPRPDSDSPDPALAFAIVRSLALAQPAPPVVAPAPFPTIRRRRWNAPASRPARPGANPESPVRCRHRLRDRPRPSRPDPDVARPGLPDPRDDGRLRELPGLPADRFDGVNHEEEAQTDRQGRKISHGGVLHVPGRELRELARRAPARPRGWGQAHHLEEPEFWVRGGYSEGFRREWRAHYGEEWQPPHSSVDAQWRSSKLKYFLDRRALQQVFDHIQDWNRRTGARVRCYVPTHSLLNYAHLTAYAIEPRPPERLRRLHRPGVDLEPPAPRTCTAECAANARSRPRFKYGATHRSPRVTGCSVGI